MRNRRLILALLSIAVATTVVAIAYAQRSRPDRDRPQTSRNNREHPRHGALFRQQDIYEHLFRHYVSLKNAAAREEREGRDGQALRAHYRRRAALTDRESELLDSIASDCVDRVTEIDSRADELIRTARERVPGGRLRAGETPPPPPAELSALQQQRERFVMQARERLRNDFTAEAFARFDTFVQQSIAGNMRDVELRNHPHRPNPRPRQRREHERRN